MQQRHGQHITGYEAVSEWELYYFPEWNGFEYRGHSFTNFGSSVYLGSIPFFAELGGALYFRAEADSNGLELWKITGHTSGDVTRVSDINPGAGDAGIQWIVTYRDKLYFQATDDGSQSDLWRFDGATSELVSDSSVTRGPTNLAVCNDKLYFHAYNSANDMLLWEYDETGPPVPVTTNALRTNDIEPPVEFMGNVYFGANIDGTPDQELYVYDGASVSRVKDINEGPSGSSPEDFYVYNDVLYFRADDGVYGEELWGLWID